MTVIGVIGLIGSGKSSFRKEAKHLGVKTIDLDKLGKKAVEKRTGDVIAAFGAGIANDEGISRPELAFKVFNDPKELKRLEAILHPIIEEKLIEKLEKVGNDLVVIEIPVAKKEVLDLCDKIVFVDTPEPVRLKRLRKKGYTKADAKARMANQPTRAELAAFADVVIDNSGSKKGLRDAAKKVLATELDGV